MFRLAQEMRIRNFSPKTIKAYLYYNKELLIFTNNLSFIYYFKSIRTASILGLIIFFDSLK